MTFALILLAIGATFRTAYLVVHERGPWGTSERLRSWVVNRYGGKSWQAEGIGCMLCVSFWAALFWGGLAAWLAPPYIVAIQSNDVASVPPMAIGVHPSLLVIALTLKFILTWWGVAGGVLLLQSWLIRR